MRRFVAAPTEAPLGEKGEGARSQRGRARGPTCRAENHAHRHLACALASSRRSPRRKVTVGLSLWEQTAQLVNLAAFVAGNAVALHRTCDALAAATVWTTFIQCAPLRLCMNGCQERACGRTGMNVCSAAVWWAGNEKGPHAPGWVGGSRPARLPGNEWRECIASLASKPLALSSFRSSNRWTCWNVLCLHLWVAGSCFQPLRGTRWGAVGVLWLEWGWGWGCPF